MKLKHLTIVLLSFVIFFSCNSANKKSEDKYNQVDTSQNSITAVKDISIILQNVPVHNIPFSLTAEDLKKGSSSSNIYLDTSLLKKDLIDIDTCKISSLINLNSDTKLLLVETYSRYSEWGYNKVFFVIKNNMITDVSAPFYPEALDDAREFAEFSVSSPDKPMIRVSYKSDELSCLDTSGLNLSENERDSLLGDNYDYKITSDGKIADYTERPKYDENNDPVKDTILTYTGKIGEDQIVLVLFEPKCCESYGKIAYQNKNAAILLGNSYTPEMCFSSTYDALSSDNKLNGNIYLLGRYGQFHYSANDDGKNILTTLIDTYKIELK